MLRPLLALCALLVTMTTLTVANAQTASSVEREKARAHFRAGKAHADARRYEAAIQEFEAGFSVEPLPGFLFNAGSVARMANQPERAIAYFDRYLAATMDAPDNADKRDARAWVEELRRELPASAPTSSPPASVIEAPAPSLQAVGDDQASARRRTRRKLAIGLGVVGGLLVIGGVAAAIAVPLSSGPPGPPAGTADWGTLSVTPR